MHGLDEAMLQKGQPTNVWSGHPTYDLEYADDTLLMGLTIPQLQTMLTGLETDALKYGMTLNETKTELISSVEHPQTLRFQSGSRVEVVSSVKYLGSLISWHKPFETAFHHRLGVAESAYKKMRLVWNCNMPRTRKIKLFMSTFVHCLTYGLDALTLTDKQLKKIDGQFYRFLRRAIGIKASYYSRVSHLDVWGQAGRPNRPSETLKVRQYKMLHDVFESQEHEPLYNVVFCSGNKDRILAQGKRRGMQFPYWIEVMHKRFHPSLSDHTAGLYGPHFKYTLMKCTLRNPLELAPKRARRNRQARARP